VALIAYGDATYEKEWAALMKSTAALIKEKAGIEEYSYGWCGHLVHYDPQKTTTAIEEVLPKKKRALVLPVLLAHDEMFQVKIIGDDIKRMAKSEERVAYRADAILPDPGVEQWIVDVTAEHTAKILARDGAKEPLAHDQPRPPPQLRLLLLVVDDRILPVGARAEPYQ
jgi:hypothetical protein